MTYESISLLMKDIRAISKDQVVVRVAAGLYRGVWGWGSLLGVGVAAEGVSVCAELNHCKIIRK